MDKNSFMQGCLLGCRLRGQRPKGETAQWETLFEGDCYTEGGLDAADISMTYPGFAVGDRIRLTVNGQSAVFTAIYKYSEESMTTYPNRKICVYVGNSEVGGGSSNGFENENIIDCDYCLLQYYLYKDNALFPDQAAAYLYTAEAGTYSVKIERLVT